MTDPESTGRQLPGYVFTVERERIREFVQAIGDPNPIFTDAEAARAQGYPDVVAPPTFGIAIDLCGGPGFAGLCASLSVNPLRVLHGEQEYAYLAPIFPGDVITAEPRVTEVTRKEGATGTMTLFQIQTTYTNQSGRTVLVARQTVIERSPGTTETA